MIRSLWAASGGDTRPFITQLPASGSARKSAHLWSYVRGHKRLGNPKVQTKIRMNNSEQFAEENVGFRGTKSQKVHSNLAMECLFAMLSVPPTYSFLAQLVGSC